MKKIIISIIIIGICIPYYSHAAGACLIKDKSAPVLLDYIKDNRIAVKNVTKAIIEKKKNIYNEKKNDKNDVNFLSGIKNGINEAAEDLEKSSNETITIFNELFNFTGYYSYFKYYVTFPISNEVPYQVKRDYRLLDNENKGLLEYIKRIDRENSTETIVKKACDGIKSKCDLNNKTVKEVIGKLIQNNDEILDLYRSSIIGDTKDFYFKDLMLVENNFILEMKKYYSKESINLCNKEKGGFFEQITTAIEEIKVLNKQGEDGIKKWQDAWQLLIGNKPNKEKKIQNEQFKIKLSNQGISVENQEILDGNLEKYNKEGLNFNNNFLSNIFSSTKNKISEKMKQWNDEILGDFLKKENDANKVISTSDINNASDNSKISINIKERIAHIYESEIPFAAVGDITTENLRAKIIKTHISLDNSIEILEKTCEYSVKVCNSQDYGAGNCGSCN